MNLDELKAYRKQRLDAFNGQKEAAVNSLQQVIDKYKAGIGATDNDVVLKQEKEMTFELSVTVNDFLWKQVIDLRIDPNDDEGSKIFAILNDISEINISDMSPVDFQKEINDRIMQAIDKQVSRYNRKIKVF